MNVFVLMSEELAAAPESRLNFIHDEEHVIFLADFRHFPEVAFRWRNNAGFALNRLDEKSRRVRCNSLPQRIAVTILD